jgi:hypothetical protein
MDPLVTVTGYTDGFDFAIGALPRAATVVTFMIGTFGPFTVRLPKATATPDVIQTAIQAKVNELRTLGLVT